MEPSSSTSSPLHFFKIIQAEAVKHKRLGIPEEFLKKFGKELSYSAIIKVPSGSIWRIGLTERGGVTSFEHGWREFMEFYSISFGHLLVFRYDGNTRFHVLIFNTSATEIEYPVYNFKTNFKGKAQVLDIDSCSSDSNNEISTQSESSSSRGGQLNLETEEPVDEHDFPKQRKVFAATVTTKRSRSNTSRVTESNERALREAEAFRSKVPCFKAIMHASCVKSGGNMHVPSDFAIPYLQHKTTRVTLRVSDRKSWDVGLIFTESFNKTTLSKGWRKFALDNHLNIGDVCVFELVDRKKFEMNVHIFQVSKTNFKDKAQVIRLDSYSTRSTNEPSTQNESSSSGGGQVNMETEEPVFCSNVREAKERALVAAEAFTSDNPFFKAIMRPFNISNGLVNIPGKFATPYLKHKTKLVTLRVSDGKSWDVSLASSISSGTTLSSGWKQFVSYNQLNQGDICVFELVDRKKFEMNVYVYRVFQRTCSRKKLETNAPWASISVETSLAAANAKLFANTLNTRRSNTSRVTQSNALAAASECKSEKPFFIANMPASCVKTGHVNVPAAFAVSYLKHETKVRLSSTGGKTWEMQCNLLHKSDRHRAKLFKGWDKFVLDNHLKEGDVCIFELVDRERFEMKAYIFRVFHNGE
ncbi:hypothetical protein MKW98_032262 [Papaver atlanticum]|uniref:TF-B3 domain-containing protein n=1 Tax=Papaver atlanticum TaxID=357466 RepID=A0AAD4SEV4_9MAGN|nr:hypothetical protein MKW98_032262 [Papaver atlanticum]